MRIPSEKELGEFAFVPIEKGRCRLVSTPPPLAPARHSPAGMIGLRYPTCIEGLLN
jgi:hypothetical protein